MLTVRTKVIERLQEKLKENKDAPYYAKNLYFSVGKQETAEAFPCLSINSLGEIQTADDLGMKQQNAIISTIELKAYAAETLDDAVLLMELAGDVMSGMGYILVKGPEDIIENASRYVMAAQFVRTVGAGDMDTF